MHLKIIAVVILAAFLAAGLGYGLLNLKDRNLEKADGAVVEVATAPPPQMAPPALQPQPTALPPVLSPPTVGQPPQPLAPPTQPPAPSAPPVYSPAVTANGQPISPEMLVPPTDNDLAKNPPLPPAGLMVMPLESKQVYFDFLIGASGKQKEMSAYYFATLMTIDRIYRDISIRHAQLVRASPQNPAGSMSMDFMQVNDPAQLMRTLEEQSQEANQLQEAIKIASTARKLLMDSLSKEQAAKVKLYVEARIF